VKDAFVDHIHTRMRVVQFILLQLDQIAANLDNIITGAFVHARVFLADIIEDVQGKGAIPGANFINDEIFVREVLEQVFRDDALSDGLSVPWL
jgi:hypothetical protein